MPSVADLYADVGFRVDKGEVRAAEGAIGRIRKGLAAVSTASKGALFGKQGREESSGRFTSKSGGLLGAARSGINRAGTSAFQSIKSGIGMGIGMGITSKISDSITGIMDVERALTRFKLEGKTTAEEMGTFRSSLGAVAIESGVSRDALLKSAATYQMLSGDSKGAREQIGLFAKVSNASGAEMEDIARVAYAMKQNLGIDPVDFEKGFSSLIASSEEGSIGLAEVAENASELAPMMARFQGGAGLRGLIDMGAAFQIVATGAGSAAQASTQMQALMGSFTLGAKKLRKGGAEVFTTDPKTGKKTLKGFRDIIDQISNSKLMNNPTLLQEALGSKEALAAFYSLSRNKDKLDEITAASERGDMVQRKAEEYRASASARFDASIEKLKVGIADVFSPERIQTFVNGLESVIAAAGRVGEALAALPGVGRSIGRGLAENDSGTSLGAAREALYAVQADTEVLQAEDASRRARLELGRARAGDVPADVATNAMRAQLMSQAMQNQITINGVSDPKEAAQAVEKVLADWWNRQVHDAEASATVGAPP